MWMSKGIKLEFPKIDLEIVFSDEIRGQYVEDSEIITLLDAKVGYG